jgi:hypothetical protein
MDLVITGLVGLRPAMGQYFTVVPLYQPAAAELIVINQPHAGHAAAAAAAADAAVDADADAAAGISSVGGWFALDNVAYHGHNLSIAYDGGGGGGGSRKKFPYPDQCSGHGAMLCVWVDGVLKGRAPGLMPLNISLLH